MRKKVDALVSAVTAVRLAAVPRAELIEAERAEQRREAKRDRDIERRELDSLRARLAAVAPEADAWFRRWARAGRLELALRARPDAPRSRIALPRFYIGARGAVWHHEDPKADREIHRWYDFALGTTHQISGGLSGIKFVGGLGGDLGTVRSLAELARKRMRYPRQRSWDGMQEDVLRVGLRVAELLSSGELEPMVVGWLRDDAKHVAARLELDRAELALLRGEADGEKRYRKVIEEQELTNDVLTADMLVHMTRRVGRTRP